MLQGGMLGEDFRLDYWLRWKTGKWFVIGAQAQDTLSKLMERIAQLAMDYSVPSIASKLNADEKLLRKQFNRLKILTIGSTSLVVSVFL